jgi:hypothetical protein
MGIPNAGASPQGLLEHPKGLAGRGGREDGDGELLLGGAVFGLLYSQEVDPSQDHPGHAIPDSQR